MSTLVFDLGMRRVYLHEKLLLVLPSDSNSRTTSSTRYNWKFFRVFSKNRQPGKLLSLMSLLSLLKEVKPSPDRKMIKLLITSTLKSLATVQSDWLSAV